MISNVVFRSILTAQTPMHISWKPSWEIIFYRGVKKILDFSWVGFGEDTQLKIGDHHLVYIKNILKVCHGHKWEAEDIDNMTKFNVIYSINKTFIECEGSDHDLVLFGSSLLKTWEKKNLPLKNLACRNWDQYVNKFGARMPLQHFFVRKSSLNDSKLKRKKHKNNSE